LSSTPEPKEKTEDTSVNGSQAFLKALVDAGLDTCFANPGTSEMQLVYDLSLPLRKGGSHERDGRLSVTVHVANRAHGHSIRESLGMASLAQKAIIGQRLLGRMIIWYTSDACSMR
jgi:hypothetical protein